jgi:hypothetical protein
MVNNYLGREEVSGYLGDLLERLNDFAVFPTVWCPLTPSGNQLVKFLLAQIDKTRPDLLDRVIVVPIYINDGRKKISFGERNPVRELAGKNVLVFDSVIHTGSTMGMAVDEVMKRGAKTVASYGLAVKRGSTFIPTLWGLMLDDADRVFLLLNNIPNQKLHSGKRKISPVCIQQLSELHLDSPKVTCGVASMDRITWGDRFFDMKSSEQERFSYVLRAGEKIFGYLTVHRAKANCLMVDEIAVAKNQHDKGFGSILIRLAHTVLAFDFLLTAKKSNFMNTIIIVRPLQQRFLWTAKNMYRWSAQL